MSIRYHRPLDRGALWQALLAVSLFGTLPVAIKATSAGPWVVGIVRLAVASAVFPLLFRISRQEYGRMLARWRILLAIGVVFATHWMTYFFSIKLSSVGLASIGVASYGVHLMWMSCVLARVRPKMEDVVSLLLVLCGVWLVVPKAQATGATLLGFGLGLFSGLLWASLPLMNQRASDLPTRLRSFPQYLIGLMLFLPFAGQAEWTLSGKDWLLLLYLSVVGTLVAHTLWVRTSTILPGAATAVIYYLQLPVALGVSWLFLGERISGLQGAGIVLIAVGSCWGILASRRVTAVQDGRKTETVVDPAMVG